MQLRLLEQHTWFSLACLVHYGLPRDLGAGPWPMVPQDAAFWGFAQRVPEKIGRGGISFGLCLILWNDKFDNIRSCSSRNIIKTLYPFENIFKVFYIISLACP